MLHPIVLSFLFTVQSWILKIVNSIASAFKVLAGLERVKGVSGKDDLLGRLLMLGKVGKVFWGIILISTILLFFFLILRIIKEATKIGSDKRTKSELARRTITAFIFFLLVPFMMLALVILTNVIVGSIYELFKMNFDVKDIDFGAEIFFISADSAYTGPPGMKDEYKKMILSGEISYLDQSDIGRAYNPMSINYFASIGGGLFILICLLIGALLFIRRIYDVMLLYIISPLVISTSVLDDGSRASTLKELIFSKVLSAYGIVISLNVFFLVMPEIQSIQIEGSYIKKEVFNMLFMMGGIIAATHAHRLISSLISRQMGDIGVVDVIHDTRMLGHKVQTVAVGIPTTVATMGKFGKVTAEQVKKYEQKIKQIKNKKEKEK